MVLVEQPARGANHDVNYLSVMTACHAGGRMEQTENKYSDNDLYEDAPGFPDEFTEGFYKLNDGLQGDGVVISDVDWASMSLGDSLGIELFVGVSGFKDASHFINWVRNKTNLKLVDWEAISIQLYKCWQLTDEKYGEGSYCYLFWRDRICTDAIKSYPVTVYALRHIDFHLKKEVSLCAFRVSRQFSLARDIWVSLNGDAEFTPASMSICRYFKHGYYLSGKAPDTDSDIDITWPSHNLPFVLDTLESFSAKGYKSLHIWEGDVGYGYKDLTQSNKNNLIKLYELYGDELPFVELAACAGIR